jgi:hypothetical protein
MAVVRARDAATPDPLGSCAVVEVACDTRHGDDRNINRPTVMSGLILSTCQIFHNPIRVFQ